MTIAYHLNHIKVEYQQRCVLDIADLSLETGKCIALLGENGAGKSTLLNLLAFITKPNQGTIQFLGQTIGSRLTPVQRQQIGVVSQQPYLLSGTVADNIQLALTLQNIEPSKHKKLIQQALQLVNLVDLAQQSVRTLSGGELKRAAIARAIAYQPEILLLDEPFSHLDQRHVQQLEDIILAYAQHSQRTVIFSTHNRFQGLALADTTINLIAGKTTNNPLINLFYGQLSQQYFDTGKIKIHATSTLTNAQHVAIDPCEIILSLQTLQSSMRNNFNGRVILIAEEAGVIRLTIDCGEQFHAIISRDALNSLDLSLGDNIWVSFKSTVVNVF